MIEIENNYWSDSELPPEALMWLSILKDYVDYAIEGNKEAIDFLFDPCFSEEFELLCELACIDFGYAKRKIKERFEKKELEKKGKLLK